ncbi:MAG: threonyl-tRNA synthetase editing domain-containing protein [Planctomycetes bacterium]|nr:threonyl-tRNA synthetase editing domain-containing protein [Planctomycetota bacterium]
MKLLMFHVRDFWFKTYERNLESASEQVSEGGMPAGGLLAWVQVESIDVAQQAEVVRKAVKNLKWLARKLGVQAITLHSFAHLSDDLAEPGPASALLAEVGERLQAVGFTVHHTPWGHFNEFRMHVEGPSLAKVWKSI